MITVLTGENNFELSRALERLAADFDGTPERLDGADIDPSQLPEILMGGTLFSSNRLVIIRGLSDNKPAWNALADWANRASDDVHLVLVDTKPDKRTATYKVLKDVADIRDFARWSDRDMRRAVEWAVSEAKVLGAKLDTRRAQAIIERSLVAGDRPGALAVDQWQAYHALEKLAVLGDAADKTPLDDIIDPSPNENVFNVFEAALKGDAQSLQRMLPTLHQAQDPYMLLGLLSTQAFQLAALAVADKPAADVARDLGAHPFAVSKLAPYAKKLGRPGARKIIATLADADMASKSTAADPWVLVERALAKIVVVSR